MKLTIRALLTALAIVLVVNVAHADSSTVIHACTNRSGELRVPPNGTCRLNEQPVEWNQQGPQGLAGTPASFRMVAGSFDPEDEDVWANIPCPDGFDAIGGTAWTSDGWNMRHPLAVELTETGVLRNFAHIDWEVTLNDGDAVFWNIVCANETV